MAPFSRPSFVAAEKKKNHLISTSEKIIPAQKIIFPAISTVYFNLPAVNSGINQVL
jgi:hypothetical protein